MSCGPEALIILWDGPQILLRQNGDVHVSGSGSLAWQLPLAFVADEARAWRPAGGSRVLAWWASQGSPSQPWKQRVNRLGKAGAAVIWLRSLVN